MGVAARVSGPGPKVVSERVAVSGNVRGPGACPEGCKGANAHEIAEARSSARRNGYYGRRFGRRLRPGRRRLLEILLPEVLMTLPPEGTRRVDPRPSFTPPPEEVRLEVGFGMGEHLADQAERHPEVGFIGCEPFVNGVASLLRHIEASGLGNVRIYPDDGRRLVAALADASIARIVALFPDPWPKARHHKRRLIQAETLDAFAHILEDGGELRLATDHAEYARWMLFCLSRHEAFAWAARGPSDWRRRPADQAETRYEAKTREEGRRPIFLTFRRLPRG